MNTSTVSRRPDFLFVFSIATLASIFTGCGGPDASTPSGGGEPAEASSTVVVAVASDIRNVNELVAEPTLFHQDLYYYILFAPLLEEQAGFEAGPPSFQPRLAESYEFSDDRKTVTLRLREATWSDGAPITAEDVRWTWLAQTHPDVGWGMAQQKQFIRDVEVVDERTVRFHFDRVYATQLLDLNLGVILPKHAWGALPFAQWRTSAEFFLDHLVVNGPFIIEHWEPGERIVLKRNVHYWEPGKPAIERLVFRVAPERSAQLAMLRSGQAHMIEWARPSDALELQKDPDVELKTYVTRGANVLFWNTSHPLFAEREVRQALTLAMDRQSCIDAVYYDYAAKTDSFYPSNVWAFNKEMGPWPYDPDRARELLAAQGWSDSDGDGVLDRDGQRFSFEILTPSGNELREDILVMIQDQLAQIGVEASQRAVEFNTLLPKTRAHDYEVAFHGVGIPTNLDLSDYFHSAAIENGFNMSAYSNPETDRILDELKTQVDLMAAKPLYDRLQLQLKEDLPVTVLYELVRIVPIRKTLRNTTPNPLSSYYGIQNWTLQEDS